MLLLSIARWRATVPLSGSFSCCADSWINDPTTAAPPSGTATTRTTPTPKSECVPAASSPQHPSPSEPLEGIPAGVEEGPRPAPVIAGPAGRSAQFRPTAPGHRPWLLGGFFLFSLSSQGVLTASVATLMDSLHLSMRISESPNNIIHPTRCRGNGDWPGWLRAGDDERSKDRAATRIMVPR